MPPITPQQPEKPTSQPVPFGGQAPQGFGAGIPTPPPANQQVQLQTTEEKLKRTQLFWYITLGVSVIILGVALFLGAQLAQSKAANSKQFDAGKKAGSDEQAKKDDTARIQASLKDTRTYTSSDELGAFTFELPKTYSISTSSSGKDQLVLLANPDKVGVQSQYLAFRLTVRDDLFTKVRESYDRDAKSKTGGLTGPEDIQVDGRTAIRYKGKLERRDKVGTIILVQVRDKTILIQTDNNDDATLLEGYNSIVSSLRIP